MLVHVRTTTGRVPCLTRSPLPRWLARGRTELPAGSTRRSSTLLLSDCETAVRHPQDVWDPWPVREFPVAAIVAGRRRAVCRHPAKTRPPRQRQGLESK